MSQKTTELVDRVRLYAAGYEGGQQPLVGRDREFRLLFNALHGIPRGHRSLILLAGEPGIGKSHLSCVFAQYALSRGVHVVHPRFEFPSPHDLQPHSALLLHVREDFQANGAELDDLFNAYPATVRAVFVVEIRAAEVSRLARLVDGRRRLTVRSVALEALSARDLQTIVRHRLPTLPTKLTADAIALAGGNPQYAIELAEASMLNGKVDFADPSTGTIRMSFERRLRTLSSSELSLLVNLAALGGNVSSALAERLLSQSKIDQELHSLRRADLIECIGARWRFRHLGLLRYLECRTPPTQIRGLHLAAARLLEREPTRDHLAIATHLQRAGDVTAAYDRAIRVAERDQTSTEVSPGAAESVEAAQLAYACARSPEARFRALLAEATAELSVGRYERAGVLFGQIALAEDASDAGRFEARAGQAEAAIGRAAWNEATLAFREGAAVSRAIAHPAVREQADLRLGLLRLRLGYAAARERSVRQAANELKHLLKRHMPAKWHQRRVWSDAWLAILAHLLSAESTAAARAFLASHSASVAALGKEFRPAALLAQGALAVRSGDLAAAADLCHRALQSAAASDPSRLKSALLNNLGVALLERGDFQAALMTLGESLSVGRSFGATAVDTVHGALNQAMCQFYAGQLTKAEEGYESVLPICEKAGLMGLFAEGSACLGLIALEVGRLEQAREASERLPVTPTLLRFDEDPFKITWLQASTHHVSGGREGVEQLRAAAEQCKDRDVLSYLKLSFLATLMSKAGQRRKIEARRELTHMGIGWFARRAEAWLLAVENANAKTR